MPPKAGIHAFPKAKQGKESASFLKKRSKKLSFTAGCDTEGASARRTESFLLPLAGRLFFKKEALTFD
jgi:predicted hydrolase (HD superfamily)